MNHVEVVSLTIQHGEGPETCALVAVDPSDPKNAAGASVECESEHRSANKPASQEALPSTTTVTTTTTSPSTARNLEDQLAMSSMRSARRVFPIYLRFTFRQGKKTKKRIDQSGKEDMKISEPLVGSHEERPQDQ